MNAYVRTTGNGYKVMCVEGAHILGGSWRNFSAEQRMYDNGGNHHFAIQIDDEFIDVFKSLGFNVGRYEKEDRDGFNYLDISISWKLRDPGVYLIAHNGVKTKLDELTVSDLDHNNNIEFADMELSPHHWTMGGREGVKPYASNLYIYLGQPSISEQRYQERFGSRQPEPAYEFTPVEDDDIPF